MEDSFPALSGFNRVRNPIAFCVVSSDINQHARNIFRNLDGAPILPVIMISSRFMFFIRPDIIRFLLVLLLFTCGFTITGNAQLYYSESYELRIAPDLRFNAVDGIMPGIRFRGEDPRTFLDGPHRLDAGLNLATRFPDTPISYYLTYTHPIPAITDVNSEGAVRVFSSMQAGLHRHEAGIRKRWQPGFDEYESVDLHVDAGFYYRFDHNYLLYETLWQDDPVMYLNTNLRKRDRNSLGRWTLSLSGITGLPLSPDDTFVDFAGQPAGRPEALGQEGLFGQVQLEALQQISLPARFQVRTRLFAGFSSNALPPEHRYLSSDATAFDQSGSRLTRARGTIPQPWVEAGWVQVSGGPGLRGYTFQNSELLEAGLQPWVRHALSLNFDFYYPNPIDTYFSKIPYLGDLLRLESYIFTDAGLLHDQSAWQDVQLNAGPGFMLSLNIPDYIGQDRGFFIRYELPVWVSDVPDGEDTFEIRHLLGVGAHYKF